MRAVRLTWTIGGIALVLCGVIGMLQYAMPDAGPAAAIVRDVIFGAAVLLFAIGLSAEASVVARRPLGVTALVIVALWPFAIHFAQPFLPTMNNETFEAGMETYRTAEAVLTAVFFVDLLVSLAAALIAVVQIARAQTVPRPWRWAPLWALLASVASWVLPQLLFTLTTPLGAQDISSTWIVLGALGFLARTLGLGILALVLASRVRSGDVEVFRSA